MMGIHLMCVLLPCIGLQKRGIVNAESLAYVIGTAHKLPINSFNIDFIKPILKQVEPAAA